MKKLLLALGISLAAFGAQASDFASLTVESVKDDVTDVKGTVQTVRVGKDLAGLTFGLQARTQATENAGGLGNSLELSVGKGFALGKVAVAPYVGVGHDNGQGGGTGWQYGVVGATAALPVGNLTPYVGAKTRINWDHGNPNQALVFAGADFAVTKQLAVGVTASKSYLDIKETSYGVNLRVAF